MLKEFIKFLVFFIVFLFLLYSLAYGYMDLLLIATPLLILVLAINGGMFHGEEGKNGI